MTKYIFYVFSILKAMINLELPKINLILKCDLLNELKKIINFHLIQNFFKNPNNTFQLGYYLESLNLNL